MRALIVADDDGGREALGSALLEAGSSWEGVAATGEADLAWALAAGPWDLVLTAYRFSWIEGPALVGRLRAALPAVPILLVAADLSAEEAVAAMKAGLTDYVPRQRLERLASVIQACTQGPVARTGADPGAHPPAGQPVDGARREILEALMEGTRTQLAYLDPQLNFVLANAAYVEASGHSRSELIGRNHFELFPNAENEAIFRKVVETGQAVEYRARPFTYADQPWRGTTYWDWTLTPVKNDGCVEGLVLSLLEVSERVRSQKLREALNEISASVSARLDVDEIMRRAMAGAAAALGCESIGVLLRDGMRWRLSHGFGPTARLVGRRFSDRQVPYAKKVSRVRDVVTVEDVGELARRPHSALVGLEVGAFMAAPLVERGVIFFNFRWPTAFDDEQISFARRLATTVSLALDNARLYEAEHEQRRQLQAVVQNAPVGIVVFGGEDLRVKWANPFFSGFLDPPFRRGDLAGLRLQDFIPRAEESGFAAIFRHVAASRQAHSEPEFRHEGFNRGTTYWRWSLLPLERPAAGTPDLLLVITDLTEEVLSRQRLERSAASLDAAIAAIPDGLILAGPDGAITRMNAAASRVLGFSAGEQALPANLRAALVDLRWPDGRPVLRADLPIERAVQGETTAGSLFQLTSRQNPAAGEPMWIAAGAAPIVAGDGEQLGAVLCFTDVSELRATQERLAAANRELERQTAALQEANAHLIEQSVSLQAQAEELEVQAAEIETQNNELEEMASSVSALNAELEQRVAERTSELEAILASLPDAVVVGDRYRVSRCNQAALDQFGARNLEELQAVMAMAAGRLRPRDPDTGRPVSMRELILDPALSGLQVTRELIVRNPTSGEDRIVRCAAGPVVRGGRTIAAVVVSTDITERRRQEEALRNNEALLRKVLATLPVGVWIADPTGKLAYENPAGRHLWGSGPFAPARAGDHKGWWVATGQPIADGEWAMTKAIARGEATLNEEIEIECFDGIHKIILNSAVPLHDDDGEIIGAIVVNEDISRLKATEAALVQHGQRLAALHEIDQAVLAARSTDEVASAAVRLLRQCIPCDLAGVGLFEDDGEGARYRWLAVDPIAGPVVRPGETVSLTGCRLLAARAEGELITANIENAGCPGSSMAEAMAAVGLQSRLCIPLTIGGEPIGALSVWRRSPDGFEAELAAVAREVADSLAVAIQQGRLNDQVRLGREQLQTLSRHLVEVQENERRLVARELHDEAGQGLTALLVGLGLIERDAACSEGIIARIADLKALVDKVMSDLHGLAVDLRPASLDKLGLAPALSQYIEQFSAQHGLHVEAHLDDLSGVRLPADTETAVYRIVQESLTNIARHADASEVGVILSLREGRLRVLVEDDGQGFDPAGALNQGRLGLLGMRERAEMLDGTLTIESAAGFGCTVLAEIPCKPLHG